jgi:hypothetical protein
MKCTAVEGDMECIEVIKGSNFAFDRPVRIKIEGRPEARVTAVSAPIEFGDGPVTRT